ncbi:hypothetical protein GCM10022291_07830 [Postechiella marina]|uniref:Putative auto-transporter adhesin head GIN domain-containing protein n=1 Tax=Postechiella marina TaxID=943941 RepID=A0ABP8C2P8_9FLAO
MKKIEIALIVTLFFSGFINAQNTTTTEQLEPFNELKVFDQINVKLVQSNKNYATISGDDTDEVSIVNNDGRLKIRMEIDNFLDGNKTYLTLYYTEDLQLVDANEGAKIKTDNKLKSNYLTLRAQEGAEIDAVITSQNLNSKAVSGGEIKVSGTTDDQDITIRSGGEYHSKGLESEKIDVAVFAGGMAKVTAKEYIDANVVAGGKIEIFGNPETVKQDKKLGGSIVMR